MPIAVVAFGKHRVVVGDVVSETGVGSVGVQVATLIDGPLVLVALRVDVLLDEALGRAEYQNLAGVLVAQVPGQTGRAVTCLTWKWVMYWLSISLW